MPQHLYVQSGGDHYVKLNELEEGQLFIKRNEMSAGLWMVCSEAGVRSFSRITCLAAPPYDPVQYASIMHHRDELANLLVKEGGYVNISADELAGKLLHFMAEKYDVVTAPAEPMSKERKIDLQL